ncbi:protein phosphatase 2c [Holotrichia oblita]|uniref:Protein phosphatase 2c n=1 Tax=Holotrichia oblita TaxID=644536 RepID=A0ACB9TGS2_HOLOL|nr:protein phosphatase 2c [Holotrichia oblita]
MDDELDDKIIYQTYVSHMKIMSKIAWGVPMNISPLAIGTYLWRLFKIYVLKPEIFVFGLIVFVVLMYIQTVHLWSNNLLGRLQYTLGKTEKSRLQKLAYFNIGDVEKSSWEKKMGPVAAYAVQGRRPKMEDRFVINDNIEKTGVALFAIFDGHGGEFAANYAKEKLVQNLYNKVIEVKGLVRGKPIKREKEIICPEEKTDPEKPVPPPTPTLQDRRKSFKKSSSTTDECIKGAKAITDTELLSKLENLRPITREVKPTKIEAVKEVPIADYIDKFGTINYGKLITDEVLATDRLLLEEAKKSMDVAGTTALIAILEGTKLVVANVGDSRGVMCDGKGNVIPLSFDHKPQQMRERKRIKEAGGFVTFNGVWRVAGILATSRAMGDYPLKDKKLVIADPDILSFDLSYHKPMFVILASDGLWDTFSNEEAVAFIKERLNESDYGAKSITLQSYYRGSLDNITVIIINFKDNSFGFYSSS